MITIKILKNGKMFKKFICNVRSMQRIFVKAQIISEKLWNGTDNFIITVD